MLVLACAACSDDPASTPAAGDAGIPDSTFTPPTGDSSASDTGSDQAEAEPPLVAMNGKLYDLLGSPLAGVKVAAGKKVTTTAADGTFKLDVNAPYDLVFAYTATGKTDPSLVWVVRGLTRLDPVLEMSVAPANRYGTFQGAVPAITNTQAMAISFEPKNQCASTSGYTLASGPATSYEFITGWDAAKDLEGTLHLWQYTKGSDNPASSFLGHLKVDNVTLAHMATKTVDFTGPLDSVIMNSIGANLTLPNGYTKGGSMFAIVRLAAGAPPLAINQTLNSSLNFTFPVPVMTGASYGVLLRAVGPASGEQSIARRAAALGGTVSVTFPAAATLATPADAATGVDSSTTFSWTGGTGSGPGISTLQIDPDTAGAPSIYITGNGTSAQLPDLSAVGVTIPAAKAFTWNVMARPDIANVDAYAKEPLPNLYCNAEAILGGDDASCTFSTSRAFVTK